MYTFQIRENYLLFDKVLGPLSFLFTCPSFLLGLFVWPFFSLLGYLSLVSPVGFRIKHLPIYKIKPHHVSYAVATGLELDTGH
jgi:hypothetical protein